MDLNAMKQFMKDSGEKFIFVEDGEPSLVVMSFSEYQNMLRHRRLYANRASARREGDMLAASFETERMRQRQAEADVHGDESFSPMPRVADPSEAVRLEDLPL